MAGTDIAAKIRALEEEITETKKRASQMDSDGDPTLAALQAQKSLPALYDRLLDWTKQATAEQPKRSPVGGMEKIYDPRSSWTSVDTSTGEETQQGTILGLRDPISGQVVSLPKDSDAKADPWQNPIDGSITDLTTGKQLSPAIPGWTPGRGVVAAPSGPSAVDRRLDWDMANYPEETRYAREQDERKMLLEREKSQLAKLQADQDREAANMRQGMSSYTSAWNENLPFALPEGQDYWAGFEPDGTMAQILKNYGLPYNAPKATRVPFDPEAAWRAGQGRR